MELINESLDKFTPKNYYNYFLKILKEKRKYIQKKRKISDRKIFNSFSGKILFQPLESRALQSANFFFNIYYKVIRLLII